MEAAPQPARLAAVSYLNTKPFLHGLPEVFASGEMELQLLVPSGCFGAYRDGLASCALLPAASLLHLADTLVLDNYCIGARERVDSVFIFGNCPMHEAEALIPDSHSMTSNGLARILCRHWWNRDLPLLPPDSPDGPRTLRVCIGDKAVPLKDKYLNTWDLAQEWFRFSGLPFVFAVWVLRPALAATALPGRLAQAFELGLNDLPRVAALHGPPNGMTPDRLLDYYVRSLDYRLDPPKKQALLRYLQLLAQLDGLETPILSFAATNSSNTPGQPV